MRAWPLRSPIRHEFQERAVGIAEIHAGTLPLRAVAYDRPEFDRDLMALEMIDRVGDRPLPLEADVAVPGLHRQARHDHAAHAGPMEIELGIAEPIGIEGTAWHHFGADHIAVERVGALPIGHMD